MPAPIQVLPQGLLGLLQLKAMGTNPTNLELNVQPQLDLFAMYINRLEVDISNQLVGGLSTKALATASPGFFVYTTNPPVVPQGFMWYVTQYTISANLLAAESLRFAPMVFATPGGAGDYVINTDVADVVTVRARMVACQARNFWLQPGWQLGFAVFDDLTAATINIVGQVRGVQIPI
jgi:hypothetical protein